MSYGYFSKYNGVVVRVFQIREHHVKIVKLGRYALQRGKIWWAPQLRLLLLGYRKPLLQPLREAGSGAPPPPHPNCALATGNLYYSHSDRQEMVDPSTAYTASWLKETLHLLCGLIRKHAPMFISSMLYIVMLVCIWSWEIWSPE